MSDPGDVSLTIERLLELVAEDLAALREAVSALPRDEQRISLGIAGRSYETNNQLTAGRPDQAKPRLLDRLDQIENRVGIYVLPVLRQVASPGRVDHREPPPPHLLVVFQWRRDLTYVGETRNVLREQATADG